MRHIFEELSALLSSNTSLPANVSAALIPHHLLVFRNTSISRVLNPVGLIAAASICSIIFGLVPYIRRGWKRAPTPRKEASSETAPNKSPTEHTIEAVSAEVSPSESFEEVTLSFGTDRPEVYMKMCKQDSPCGVIQAATLRQLVVH